ncbi:MAG: PIG-L family deacetylase [Chlamydiota bacterium]|nr:PIG-L family deacetylase [Chlamydiota bacterium]
MKILRISRKWIVLLALLFLRMHQIGSSFDQTGIPDKDKIEITAQDRILILAPHPDDEVLGCAGIIQQAVAFKLPIEIVFFTNGDNNELSFILYRKRPVLIPKAVQNMGLIRQKEAIEAASVLGLSSEQLIFLGYPDFGSLSIWIKHWAGSPPFRSMLTKANKVPYKSAFRYGASYKGEEILKDLQNVLKTFQPTRIFVSHPADTNPDHRALYFFLKVAIWNLDQEMNPEIYPYLIHYPRWPRQKGFYPSLSLTPPTQLQDNMVWRIFHLDPSLIQKKRQALKEHKTQYEYSAKYLQSFIRNNELFGDYEEIKAIAIVSEQLFSGESEDQTVFPENLIGEEREKYIGLLERSICVKNQQLILTIRLSKPLMEPVEVSVYIFGYKWDRAFGEMPKLHVRFGITGYSVYDQDRKLSQKKVIVKRTSNKIVIQIPLVELGDPDKVLTSARSYLKQVPLDWMSWRIIQITNSLLKKS